MGIALAANFTVNTALPIDDRFVFADITARDALSALRRYEGMIVYVSSLDSVYLLKGGILNANWAPLKGGSGSVPINWQLDQELAPTRYTYYQIPFLRFADNEEQRMYCQFRVPDDYTTGKQIFIKGLNAICAQTSGNVYFYADIYRYTPGTSNIGDFSFRTSLNAVTPVASLAAENIFAVQDIDVTTAIGQIDGLNVAPGDILSIYFYRGTTGDTVAGNVDLFQFGSFISIAE